MYTIVQPVIGGRAQVQCAYTFIVYPYIRVQVRLLPYVLMLLYSYAYAPMLVLDARIFRVPYVLVLVCVYARMLLCTYAPMHLSYAAMHVHLITAGVA